MFKHIMVLFFYASLLLPFPPGIASEKEYSYSSGDLVIENPWARESIGTIRPSAAYMTIRNSGTAADTLIRIEAPVAGIAQLHKMEMKENISTMTPENSLSIPELANVTLAPNGRHIMLMKLTRALSTGEHFPLTLVFERAGPIEVWVRVFHLGSSGPEK